MNADELKVLFIGNSFSDNMIHNLYPIAKAFGYKKVRICNLYIGGCTIETHVDNLRFNKPAYTYREVSDETNGVIVSTDNVKMIDGIKDDNWDFISFQQASHYSGLKETYSDGLLPELIDYVKSNMTNPKAKFMWHMTWAYQQDSTHPDFYRYEYSQKKMYECICDCVKNYIIPNNSIDLVIPSGMMIQKLRETSFGDTLTGDGYHLNLYGEAGIGIIFMMIVSHKGRSSFNDEMLQPELREYIDLYFDAANKSLNDYSKLEK